MGIVWSVQGGALGFLPEKLSEPFDSQLKALAALFAPHLVINRIDGVNHGTEQNPRHGTIYTLQVRAPWSVLSHLGESLGAFHGPGAARETLSEAVGSLFEWVATFKGCGVFVPRVKSTIGIYGPASDEKRCAVQLWGVIPNVWPSTPPENSRLRASPIFLDSRLRALSLEAQVAVAKIGLGLRLCIPREGTAGLSLLMPDPGWPCVGFEREELAVAVAAELVGGAPQQYGPGNPAPWPANKGFGSSLLGELPEFQENQKRGWRDSGLPGDLYRVFALVQ